MTGVNSLLDEVIAVTVMVWFCRRDLRLMSATWPDLRLTTVLSVSTSWAATVPCGETSRAAGCNSKLELASRFVNWG